MSKYIMKDNNYRCEKVKKNKCNVMIMALDLLVLSFYMSLLVSETVLVGFFPKIFNQSPKPAIVIQLG